VRAEVKYFEWPDLDRIDSHRSVEGSALLVFAAGPLGSEGAETFQATVCTPGALADLVERDGVLAGRHFNFVESLNTDRVEDFIRDRLRRLDGDTWQHLAEKIGRLGFWEFEDYPSST
jgi:hypothetical protein